MRTGPGGGSGVARRRRSTVRALTRTPSAARCRTPGSPPRSKPVRRTCAVKRVVRRAKGATRSGRRSAKMRRRHPRAGQTKRRTRRCRTTRSPPHGRSARVRPYAECLLLERRRHSGQRAARRVVTTSRCSTTPSRHTRGTRTPATCGKSNVVTSVVLAFLQTVRLSAGLAYRLWGLIGSAGDPISAHKRWGSLVTGRST